mmetsp:Transcript_37968/g.100426  ORF Transcript_37968/g.100426 Transcript_37968/m.100426 type:complete len:296 (-) Transcript_37968:35-922(-)
MSETHAYGASFGCLSRRHYILAVAWVTLALCLLQIFRWVYAFSVWNTFLGLPVPAVHTHGCTGTECYEVFTCFGMKDATRHLREPLASLAGAAFAPLGIYGAVHGSHRHLQTFALFLAASAALHVGTVAADGAFFETCGAYSGNMLWQTVLTWPLGAIVPISRVTVDQLSRTPSFTVPVVDSIVGGFNLLVWYFVFAGAYALILVYTAREASLLAYLAERGTLGLGVHYGLNRWDEIINHDAIRRSKARETHSQFIEDARLPSASEEDAALGYGESAGYGATADKRTYYAGNLPA